MINFFNIWGLENHLIRTKRLLEVERNKPKRNYERMKRLEIKIKKFKAELKEKRLNKRKKR